MSPPHPRRRRRTPDVAAAGVVSDAARSDSDAARVASDDAIRIISDAACASKNTLLRLTMIAPSFWATTLARSLVLSLSRSLSLPF